MQHSQAQNISPYSSGYDVSEGRARSNTKPPCQTQRVLYRALVKELLFPSLLLLVLATIVPHSYAQHRHGTLEVSSSVLSFGSVDVGQSTIETVQLMWTGHSALTVTSDALSGTGFSLTGVLFPFTLEPQVAATIPVRWAPAAAGSGIGQLSFLSQATGRRSSVVNLSGTGTAATRLLRISPSTLNFGSVALHGTMAQAVTLTSVGTSTLSLLSSAISGADFRIVSGTVPDQLAPNQSLTLQIQFTAAAAGAATGQLEITSNATNGTSATLALSGLGRSAPTAQISASASTLNFGSVVLNKPANQTLTLTSSGTASLTVLSVRASGTGYHIVTGTLPVTLAPKQTTTLQVQFDPTSVGTDAQELTVASNAATDSSLMVALSGSGRAAHTVQLEWSPPSSSPEPVTGYNIYRSVAGQALQKLNSTPQPQSSYVDVAVADATTYTYEVKSVDAQAIESVASEVTEVSVP